MHSKTVIRLIGLFFSVMYATKKHDVKGTIKTRTSWYA